MIEPGPLSRITDTVSAEFWDGDRLRAEIARRASVMRRFGAGRGRCVIIHRGARPAFFADLFAAWRLGACVACTHPGLSDDELGIIVDFISPAVVLVGDDFAGDARLPVPVVDAGTELPGADPGTLPPGDATLDDPALILFTSGTTGTPKGVVHSYRSLLARAALNRAHIGDAVLARTLCVLPPHFGHGLIGNCLTPLLAGQHLFLAPGIDVRQAARLGDILGDHAISFMSSVPALWRLALRVARPPAEQTLRQVNVGSAPLSADLWKSIISWAGTRNVLNMYGITETANWLAGASGADHEPEDGLIGRMWGGSMGVRADDGTIRRQGEGEIVVQSPSLMQGYYRLPELTAEVLRGGWFHTGDTGSIDATGTARLTGRIKHEINRAGIKIHPEDVDLLLERHPAVGESCTFGMPDEISGEIVAVAVRLRDDVRVSVDELRTWCRARLRREAVPEKWYIVEEIPKTDRGKVNRRHVMEHCAGRAR